MPLMYYVDIGWGPGLGDGLMDLYGFEQVGRQGSHAKGVGVWLSPRAPAATLRRRRHWA